MLTRQGESGGFTGNNPINLRHIAYSVFVYLNSEIARPTKDDIPRPRLPERMKASVGTGTELRRFQAMALEYLVELAAIAFRQPGRQCHIPLRQLENAHNIIPLELCAGFVQGK